MIAQAMMIPAAVALLVAASLTPLLARWAKNRNLLDVPNPRSSHVVATPRTGGAAFVAGVLAGIAAFTFASGGLAEESLLVVAAACGIALLGLVDDFRPLPASIRLLVQTGISVLAVSALDVTPFSSNVPGWVAAALTVFWLVAITNAYNFMDGIDGIGAGQALVAGLGWAVLGSVLGSRDTVLLGLLGAAAPAGFLIHNRPPARVFMGDAGSGFLGFFFGALPLTVTGGGPDVLIWAVLLTWPFLFDTGFTLLRRLRRGENIFSAHRSHLYQRLTVSGLPHGRVSLLYAGLAAIGAGGAIAHATGQSGAAGMAAAAVAAAAFGLWRYVVAREARPDVANATPGGRP